MTAITYFLLTKSAKGIASSNLSNQVVQNFNNLQKDLIDSPLFETEEELKMNFKFCFPATTLKELKDFAETKHIPVHIVSSQDLDSKITKESGAIDFTNKPISDDNMQNVFRSLEEIASKETGKIALFSDKKRARFGNDRIFKRTPN